MREIKTIVNGKIEDSHSLQINVEKYFGEDIGLTIEEFKTLKDILSGEAQ